jgi:hypothetical protein
MDKKNEIEKAVKSMPDELLKAFKDMPQARTDYTLRYLVIGQHDTIQQQYAHTILELRLAYTGLQKAKINLERMDYEIAELKQKGDKPSEFEMREKQVDKYTLECAVIGKLREFNCLYKIWQSFPEKFTRADVNANQEEYWEKRLIRQANQDLMANGRVSVGNQDALRTIDKGVTPQLDHVRDIEHKYIEGENSNTKMMVAVPVEKDISEEEQSKFRLPCIDGLIEPSGMQFKYFTVHGRKIDAAYNEIARQFLQDGADYLLTIEDDTFPPKDVIVKLMKHIADGKKVVGAWYPMRDGTGNGVPIALHNNGNGKTAREQLAADGKVHEVYTIPMGCTLYSAEVFFKIEQPFFAKTSCLTQDSFFSQKLRKAGYKLYCDTCIRCKHIDRETSVVYE